MTNPITAFPIAFAANNGVLLLQENNKDTLVCRRNVAITALQEIYRVTAISFIVRQVDDNEFDKLLESSHSKNAENSQLIAGSIEDNTMDFADVATALSAPDNLLVSDSDAPIIKLLNSIFFEAIQEKASDIHVEPYEKKLDIRFRLDGSLNTVLSSSAKVAPLLISRIKILANLDIAEKRSPQDGRITTRIGNRIVDLRVSILPSAYGERVVLRILDKEATNLELDSLGIPPDMRIKLEEIIKMPHGIFMITGPTGSGKTTTLYALLNKIDKKILNIMTVEDPIEYYFEGISQTQVNPKAGMTFAKGLRAILRQDPDVIMLGEIRDAETAQISCQASLTGHLVLSTIHTNTAIGVITRLCNIGIEPFLVASTTQAILAQRLVKSLCNTCKQPYIADEIESKFLAKLGKKITLYRQGSGCQNCKHSGFSGRTGIYELIVIDKKMKNMITDGRSEDELYNYCLIQNKTMLQCAIDKVLSGETTIDEVLRVTRIN